VKQPIVVKGLLQARCNSVAPIMPTTDTARTKSHYERLGFAVSVYGDFVMTKRDDIEIFLSLKPEHDPARTASCIFVRVSDANALHEEWSGNCVPGLRDLYDTDYRMREFPYIDPDGNLILFGSPLS
jgi:hypothetical protein